MDLTGLFSSAKAVVVGIIAILAGWVYLLRSDNKEQSAKIDDLEQELEVQEKVLEDEADVREFKGAVEAQEPALEQKRKEAKDAYEKAQNVGKETKDEDSNNGFTWA